MKTEEKESTLSDKLKKHIESLSQEQFDKQWKEVTDLDLSSPTLEEFQQSISVTYSIPIYENGIKTKWSVDGIVGDEKYYKLLEFGNGTDLPDIINTTTKNIKE